MNLAHHSIFALCVATAIIVAIVTGIEGSKGSEDHLLDVVFWALSFLAGAGILGFVLQFFKSKRHASNCVGCIFFGFFAGLMATNFMSEIASRTRFVSLSGYLTSYGLMVFYFGLSVIGISLLWLKERRRIAEQDAGDELPPRLSARRVAANRTRRSRSSLRFRRQFSAWR